jgi:hypothetical protein
VIVCTKCGNQESDGVDFCGACGSFLEWTGEKVRVAQPEQPADPLPPEPVEEPQRGGIVAVVKTKLGLDHEAEERQQMEQARLEAAQQAEVATQSANERVAAHAQARLADEDRARLVFAA